MYDQKLIEYQNKCFILINWAVAARFGITIGNYGFYNGTNAENFEIDFLTRMIYQYGSTIYQKKQNCHILRGMFFCDFLNIVGENHDFRLLRLQQSAIEFSKTKKS